MSVHYSSHRHDWQTPDVVWGLVGEALGGDPQSIYDPCPVGGTDGLTSRWESPWYCNPPFGRELPKFVDKAIEQGGPGILLCPARTDTKWWAKLWDASVSVCFWRGRMRFSGSANAAPFPTALFFLTDGVVGPWPFELAFVGHGILARCG